RRIPADVVGLPAPEGAVVGVHGGVARGEAEDAAGEQRFACPGGADDGEALAGREVEVDLVEQLRAVDVEREVSDAEQRLGGAGGSLEQWFGRDGGGVAQGFAHRGLPTVRVRSQRPTVLVAMTVMVMVRPGKTAIHHAVLRKLRPSER